MTIAELLLPEFDQEVAKTRRMLALVPAERFDYTPHPRSMTLGALASHVADIPSWAKMTMSTELLEFGDDFAPWQAATTQDLLDRIDAASGEARTALTGAADEMMHVTWTLTWNGQVVVSQPRHQVLRDFVFNHLVHHRAQLGVYLRLLDVAIPGMYGPSADDMAAMARP
jgi:uncharacterized damage-inducible protein DinB